jgi:hypothetical protein
MKYWLITLPRKTVVFNERFLNGFKKTTKKSFSSEIDIEKLNHT